MQDVTQQEIRALTLWKHRYSLESQGFTRAEAERLTFWRWWWANRAGALDTVRAQ